MHVNHQDGTLYISMPMQEFLDALIGARAAGVMEGSKRAQTGMANGTRATTTAAKKPVRARSTRRSNARHVARRSVKAKRQSSGKRDWKAITAKRLATRARKRAERMAAQEQPAQQAQQTAEAI